MPTMASTTLRVGTISSRTGRPTRSARATTSDSSRRSYAVGVVWPALSSLTSTSSIRAVMTTTSRSPEVWRAASTWARRCGLRTGTSTLPGLASIWSGDSSAASSRSKLLSSARTSTGAACRTAALNQAVSRAIESQRGNRGDVAAQHHCQGAHRDDTPDGEQAQRNLAAARAHVAARLERDRAPARPPEPGERCDRQHEHHGNRDPVGPRQPGHPPACREHHENHRQNRDVHRAGGCAEPAVKRCQPRRQRAVGRGTMEHLLGVAKGGVGRRSQDQHRRGRQRHGQQDPDGRRRGQMLREAGQRCIRPERLLARRHQQQREERPERGRHAGKQDGQPAGAAQGLHAWRRELVGGARQRFTAAEHRQRQREAEQDGERHVQRRPWRDCGNRRRHGERGEDDAARGRRHAPGDGDQEDGDADPDGARQRIAADIAADAGREPEQRR